MWLINIVCGLSTTSVSGFLDAKIKPDIRGPTAPFENVKLFDQYVAKGVQPAYMREAELKHGRLAMVASLSEQFTYRLGINFFQENPEFVVSGISLMVYGREDPPIRLR